MKKGVKKSQVAVYIIIAIAIISTVIFLMYFKRDAIMSLFRGKTQEQLNFDNSVSSI